MDAHARLDAPFVFALTVDDLHALARGEVPEWLRAYSFVKATRYGEEAAARTGSSAAPQAPGGPVRGAASDSIAVADRVTTGGATAACSGGAGVCSERASAEAGAAP